ncbi:MAG: ribosome-associated translation inhibitor RaiA [Lentisphaeraceae bacterium]|nr:ribosome-associated translation inhibitor RaiA [Lentisphaeraceae bacterium]
MDIIVSARHMELTEAMRNSATSSLESINHGRQLTRAEVVLDTDHNKFIAEIIVHGNKINLEAKAEMDDMYAAIDKAVDRLQTQIDKKFSKMLDSHKGPHLGEIEAEYVEALSAEAAEDDF